MLSVIFDGNRVGVGVLLSALIIAVMCFAVVRADAANDPKKLVITYFYTPGCPGCQPIQERLEKAQREHKEIELRLFNLADPENVEKMNGMYDEYQVPYDKWNGRLVVFVAKRYFVSEEEVKDQFEAALTDALSAMKEKSQPEVAPTTKAAATDTSARAEPAKPAVNTQAHAPAPAQPDAQRRQATESIQSKPTKGDILQPKAEEDIIQAKKGPAVTQIAPQENPSVVPPPQSSAESIAPVQTTGSTKSRLFRLFESLGIGTILVSGLIDGINPCAFATLIFFVSYLSYLGRGKREIWLVGSMFSLGVFIAYVSVGLGLLRAVQLAWQFQAVSKASYGVIGLGSLVLAGISLADWRKARVGEFKDMSLQLPGALKRWSHQMIRAQKKTRCLWIGAFFVGVAVSILELACTGQVYVPTITYVMSVPAYREKALICLLAYSGMFILPLLTVFLLVGFGFSSERLVQLSRKHTAKAKLLLSGVFATLGVFLILQSARAFGWIG